MLHFLLYSFHIFCYTISLSVLEIDKCTNLAIFSGRSDPWVTQGKMCAPMDKTEFKNLRSMGKTVKQGSTFTGKTGLKTIVRMWR
jgi:hypothetical protein